VLARAAAATDSACRHIRMNMLLVAFDLHTQVGSRHKGIPSRLHQSRGWPCLRSFNAAIAALGSSASVPPRSCSLSAMASASVFLSESPSPAVMEAPMGYGLVGRITLPVVQQHTHPNKQSRSYACLSLSNLSLSLEYRPTIAISRKTQRVRSLCQTVKSRTLCLARLVPNIREVWRLYPHVSLVV
jgi:hypothetical protein